MTSTSLLHTQTVLIQSRKLMATRHLLISVYTSRRRSELAMFRSELSYRWLSAPLLIVRRWLPNFSSARSLPSPILSPPPSAIYWQPSLRTFLWTRVPLGGRQKLLLQLIFLIYFSFFRAWNSPTLLGRILQSQTRTSVQHVLIILLSVLHVVQISFLSVQSIFSFHQIIISSRSTYLFLYSIFFPSVKILFLIRSQCVSLCLQYSSRSLNLSSPFSLTFFFFA